MNRSRRALVSLGVLCLIGAVALPLAATDPPPTDPVPFAADPELVDFAQRAAFARGMTRQKTEAIVDSIFDRRGGLGFQYARRPTRTAIEAFRARSGNCVSLVNLFVAMARSAGLNAYFVEVTDFERFHRWNGQVLRASHLVGGVWLGSRMSTVDFLPDRPKVYRGLRPISDERAAAHYYNSIAAEALVDGDLELAAERLAAALRFDDTFAEAWNNLAIAAKRQGRLADGIAHLERALEAEPDFIPALENLSGFYLLAGRQQLAQAAAQRAVELKTRNPYYLVDQAAVAFEAGDLEDAEQLLRTVRKIDNRLPEIPLLLGRIALARGDREGATHLFAKAQRASEELSSEYQRGLDSKIDGLLASNH